MNELQRIHATVWRFRAVMEPYWATPEPIDCLRYAFCEAAEAMDAWLRQQRPNDSRNNERQPDVLDELADCAIMLLSAVPEDGTVVSLYTFKTVGASGKWELDMIGTKVAGLLQAAPVGIIVREIGRIIVSISCYPGMNLEERVNSRLTNIAWKHAPKEMWAQAIDALYQ